MITSAKIARYLLIFSLIVSFSLVLPEFYSRLFSKSIAKPYVYYSSISNEFVFTEFKDGNLQRTDSKGNELSREEFERLTPFFNYKQLLYREEMPDTIQGIPIDLQELRLNGIYFSVRSSDIFSYKIPIAPLLESKPGRPDLSMPVEFIRIADELQFIDSESNSVLPELSKLFNDELISKGFHFPAKRMFGNPTTRKPFDEGYFIIDNEGDLFHLKRVKNKPYVVKINLPSDINVKFVVVREMNLKEFYALMITEDNRLFLITYDNYKIIELPSDGYDCANYKLIFKGNLLYREISFRNQNSIRSIITDRNYKVIDTYYDEWESNEESMVGIISKSIFPFKISFEDNNNSFINFYTEVSGFEYLIGNIIAFLIGLVLLTTKFKRKNSTKIMDLLIVLFTGIYGLIAVLLIRDEN